MCALLVLTVYIISLSLSRNIYKKREFYCSKAGGFADNRHPGGEWMRPSYGRYSMRVDVLWFDVKDRIPYEFFRQLWDYLIVEAKLDFRCHWGKWIPGGNTPFPKPTAAIKNWSDYFASQYPKWDSFLGLRAKLDPNGVFLTDYWCYALGLDPTEMAKKAERVAGVGDGAEEVAVGGDGRRGGGAGTAGGRVPTHTVAS